MKSGVVEGLMCVVNGLDHIVTVWLALVNYYLECISPPSLVLILDWHACCAAWRYVSDRNGSIVWMRVLKGLDFIYCHIIECVVVCLINFKCLKT